MLAGAELPLLERGARLTNGKPSGGVSGARVAGREVELVTGMHRAVRVARSLSRRRGGSSSTRLSTPWLALFADGDPLIVQELARKYPEVIFVPAWSAAQELTLRNPAANVYRFDTDGAQDVAGLGSYAYRELGWRRAAVVGDPLSLGWQEEAAFVAEFCALGGNVTARFSYADRPQRPEGRQCSRRAPTVSPRSSSGGLHWARVSARARPRAGVARDPDRRRHRWARQLDHARTHPQPARRGRRRVVDSAGQLDTCDAQAPNRLHEGVSRAAAGVRGGAVVLAFHDAMEGLLRGLEAADGDLSDGRRRLREELARVRFDLPSSPVRLDRNRQAVRNVYLKRIDYEGGKQVSRLVRVVPDVEQTFGGLLSKSPPPGPGSQPCRKATPPPWAR